MNIPRSLLIAAMIISMSVACSPVQEASNQPIDVINEIRKSLELPELPLEFVENTKMANSPSGSLEVSNYRDSEGRIYSVNTETNQVVEIDARGILPNKYADSPAVSPDEIKDKAMLFAKTVIPNFNALQPALEFEEGGKVNNYFFSWYGEMDPDSMNRPCLQFGFHKSGLLFAYYNTLSVEK